MGAVDQCASVSMLSLGSRIEGSHDFSVGRLSELEVSPERRAVLGWQTVCFMAQRVHGN